MSIAAANLFTRNIYREYLRPACTDKQEATTAKIVSLVVKLGALAFIVLLPQKYAIQLQLLGGVWILQTFPAVVLGLYTRWFHRRGLLAGWALGMGMGTWMCETTGFKSTTYALKLGAMSLPGYAALWSVLTNLMLAALATVALDALGAARGEDETVPEDYFADRA
jgi:SSS family solute:Na+ symporter